MAFDDLQAEQLAAELIPFLFGSSTEDWQELPESERVRAIEISRAALQNAGRILQDPDIREFLAGDVHHHMNTIAGLLRMEQDERLVSYGDQLSDCCRRLRERLLFVDFADLERRQQLIDQARGETER